MSNQTFQVIYIDDESENPKDKIVLIEETQESLPEATGILNTLEKETKYGIVAVGSAIAIANLRANLYDNDKEKNLGSKEIVDILTGIVDIIFASECEVAHYKGPQFYDPIPKLMEKVSVAIDLSFIKDLKGNIKNTWDKFLSDSTKDIGNKDMSDKDFEELEKYLKNNENSYKELEKVLKESEDPNVKKLMNVLDNMDVDEVDDYYGAEFDGIKYKIKAGKEQTVESLVDLIVYSYFSDSIKDEEKDAGKPISYKEFANDYKLKHKKADEETIRDAYQIELKEIENDKKIDSEEKNKLKKVIKENVIKNIVNIGFLPNKKDILLISNKPIKINPKILEVSSPTKLKLEEIKKYDFSSYKKYEKANK